MTKKCKHPAIPLVKHSNMDVQRQLDAIRESLEIFQGVRGDPDCRAATVGELARSVPTPVSTKRAGVGLPATPTTAQATEVGRAQRYYEH